MDENRNTKEPSCCQPRFNEHSAPNRDDPVSAEDVPVQNGNGHIGLDTSRTLVTEVISEKTELMSDTYMNGDSSHQVKFEDSEEPVVEIEVEKIRPLHYSVSETPPPHLLALFGLQQALLLISAPLGVSIVVAEVICAQKDEVIKAQILSASMFMCGLATFLMNTFGVRLPIFQGPTSMYIVPLLVISSSAEWQCPETYEGINPIDNSTIFLTNVGNNTAIPAREIILTKISQLSGSLMLVGVLHVLIGATGIVGIIIRYIGPITIVPTIVLVGLYLFKVIVKFAKPSWLVASVTCAINLTLSLFLSKKKTPVPLWSPDKGFHIFWFPLHQMFSVMISLLAGWAFSAVLTVSGFYTDDPTSEEFLARTDAKGDIIAKASFFEVPYPGKFGSFSFSTAGFLSFFIATLMSVLNSIGDYSACARTARVTPLPRFAFNRGIAVEGVATILSGSMGCCHATVSYGGNIGAMGITGVASRRVFQLSGIIYVLCAVIGKIGAFFITIPLPVLGGTTLVMMGLFIGMVLSYLESINLRSTRNLAILGMSLLLGLMLPYWVANNPQGINTGSPQVDTLLKILLSNPSFAGGFFACVMDNTVPGTLKDRGLLEQMKELDGDGDDLLSEKTEYMEGREVYRLPFVPDAFRRSRIAKIFPIFDSPSK